MKAWNFCLVLLRGASPATCQHRECRERALGPVGHRAQTATAQGTAALQAPGDAPSLTLTCFHRGFHHAPGGIFPLAGDNILLERLQPVLHQGVERGAEGVQQQVAHVGVEPAVPQLGLREAQGQGREGKGSTRP